MVWVTKLSQTARGKLHKPVCLGSKLNSWTRQCPGSKAASVRGHGTAHFHLLSDVSWMPVFPSLLREWLKFASISITHPYLPFPQTEINFYQEYDIIEREDFLFIYFQKLFFLLWVFIFFLWGFYYFFLYFYCYDFCNLCTNWILCHNGFVLKAA